MPRDQLTLGTGRTALECDVATYAAALRVIGDHLHELADGFDAVVEAMTALPAPPSPLLTSGLSPRQHQILGMRARDMLPKQIARELGTSEKTIRNQIAQAAGKMGLSGYQAITAYRMLLEALRVNGVVVRRDPRGPDRRAGVGDPPAPPRESVPA
jgi:DNA-binding CsgD family transcriptional regulator